MIRCHQLALGTLLLASFAVPAAAGIPSPTGSRVDSRLVTCPAGDAVFHVYVGNLGGDPYAGSQVAIDFCAANGWALCTGGQPAGISFFGACEPYGFSGPAGDAAIALRAGGTTADSTVAILADGVLLAHRVLASPDQNGDLTVDAADEAILLSKLGTHDLSADFDGDGTVTAADRAILRAHLGHTCALATPALPRTWGGLKTVYR